MRLGMIGAESHGRFCTHDSMKATDLIASPYHPPKLRKGDLTFCLYRERHAAELEGGFQGCQEGFLVHGWDLLGMGARTHSRLVGGSRSLRNDNPRNGTILVKMNCHIIVIRSKQAQSQRAEEGEVSRQGMRKV